MKLSVSQASEVNVMKKAIGLIVATIVGATAFGLSKYYVSEFFGGSVESKIEKLAREMNQKLPQQIDEVTRLDRVDAGPGKSYAYNYTVSIELSDAEKRQIQENITREVLAKAEMKPIFDAGVTVWYRYFDAKGAKVLEFSVRR